VYTLPQPTRLCQAIRLPKLTLT